MGGSNPQAISLLYIVGLFAILYFLMIRPQQQRQKKHTEMIKSIKQNDKVITIYSFFLFYYVMRQKGISGEGTLTA